MDEYDLSRRLEALQLAVSTSYDGEPNDHILDRAEAFDAFLKGREGTDGDAA